MSLIEMPPQTTDPHFCERAQCYRHKVTDRGKQQRGIEFDGRALIAVACPDYAEPTSEFLRRDGAGTRESIDVPALMVRYLCHDVARGTETVNADTLTVTRHHERTKANQPGTQQWRGLNIAVSTR